MFLDAKQKLVVLPKNNQQHKKVVISYFEQYQNVKSTKLRNWFNSSVSCSMRTVIFHNYIDMCT